MRRAIPIASLTLILLVGAWAVAAAREEIAGVDIPAKLVNAQMNRELRSAVQIPRSSAAGDTTYVGFVPGKVTATNYWGIGVGAYHPYSTNPADYGYWSWDNDALHDNIAEAHGDSLFGWWPIRNIMNGTGGLTLTDDNRPWWALDIGNTVNYVLSQETAHRRTFGVVGVWHRDDGSTSGGGVTWSALSGSYSLWCGLRREGDLSFIDPVTKSPFNATPLAFNEIQGGSAGGGTGTNRLFPGYGSQWDQMAYRDVDVTGASTISVRFRFRTNMSTGRGTAANTRTGWFDKDPLQVTAAGAAAGNFISSSAAGNDAPIDSFMVYVGAPVSDSLGQPSSDGSEWFMASDGNMRRVFDRQRRWFSEVIRANEGLYREILSTFGDHAANQVTISDIDLTGASANGRARLVFRNKTNRGFDDESGSVPGNYSSGGAGAVVIDDVEVALDGGSFSTLGNFESPGDVDNDLAVSPLDAWKSTGKPPQAYHHVHSTDDLIYEDLCGPVGGALRICNLSGNVISMGDHDNSEALGGLIAGTADREPFDCIVSPTINLRNGGGTNEMGIDADIAVTTNDYYLIYEIYTGAFDLFYDGNEWRFAFACYPARQRDGTLCWSDFRFIAGLFFNPDKQCFQDQEPAKAFGLLSWSSADAEGGAAYPDSIRMMLQHRQECYRFGISTGCAATDGNYIDNISMAFIDGSSPPISVNIWDWVNDTFTVNGLNRNGISVTSSNFDTTTALVKIGLNIAQSPGNTSRYAVPGDTTAITALGDNVRIDLVFRIDPGPGNYVTLGNRASGLRGVPTSATGINYTTPGGNFWANYLADNGAHGTPAGHPAGATNGGRDWSSLVWNSARCDTAEANLYQISARGIGIPGLGAFQTTYEETDPKFTVLGIARNRCFLTTPTAVVDQAHTVCDINLTNGWPTAAGYVAENGLPIGQTYEYTKILPDGQFTPGTHVEYFIRREDTPVGNGPYILPDTNAVFPQTVEGSTDAHRWQEFSVLPDAWKKGTYGGLGQACILVVDLNDRRGDERVWVSIADSIGETSTAKYGAHNGWHAVGKADLNDPAGFVYNINQQPGTVWDMFQVKGSESLNAKTAGLGVDLSNHASSYQIDNKWSFQGPSLTMLESFYKVILILSGDLNSGILGPFSNFGSNDVKMLQDFMLGGQAGDSNHRGVWCMGDGFVESADATASNASLISSFFYVSLRDPSYLLLSGNPGGCVDLVTQSPITNNGDIYGVNNGCLFTDDVVLNGIHSVPSTLYAPAGNASAPVIAGVFHDIDDVNGEYWQSVVDGWDIKNLLGRFCGSRYGRLAYFYNVRTNIFGKICQIAGNPPQTTDVPGGELGADVVDFMALRNNPLVSGRAAVDFGLAKADRVEVKIYDVSGRLVRTLADRQFAPGKYTLTWDGVDNDGRQVARGVFFTQVRYLGRGFTEARKLTVLK